MKRKTKSKFSSVIFILSCLLICGVSLYLFYADFNRTYVKNETEIATIHFKKKVAQRKFSDSVVWERLQVDSPLYNEDIIRTDSGSSAVLTFSNGASIDLGEHSMIQIFQGKDNELSLQVSGGTIVVDTKDAKDNIKVSMGNNVVINLEKGSVLSTDSAGDQKSFVVHEGSGSVVSSDGKENVVFAGETISVDKNGSQKKLPVTVMNVTQNQQVLFFDGGEKKVELELKADSSVTDKKIIIESSYTSDFSEIAERIEADASERSVPLSAQPGNLYWRIYPEDEIENATEGKLFIEQTSPPVLVSPSPDSVFELENYTEKITFTWKADRNTDFCRVEIYDENDTAAPIFSGEVSGTTFSYSQFYEGSFLWSVTPHYAANKNDFGSPSPQQKFSVTKKQINDSPVLLFPQDNSVITLDTKESGVLFGWKSDIKDSEYSFEISKDEDFRSVLYDSQENGTRKQFDLSIGTMPEGNYFWRVARKSGENDFYSDVRRFSVVQYVPVTTQLVYPPDNFTVESEKLKSTQFSWKIAGDVPAESAECILQFSTRSDFENKGDKNQFFEFKTSAANIKGIQLAAGTYYWQIKIVDKTTNAEQAKTDARKISVVSPLEPPAFVFPKNNGEYVVTRDSALKCEWEAVKEADSYSVKVYNAATNEIIAKVDSTGDTALEMRIPQYDELKRSGGELLLKYSVTAFSSEKENSPMRSSRNATQNCTLIFAEKVALASPLHNAEIAGLTAVRTPTQFTWTEDKNVYKKELILTKKMTNGTSRVVNTVQNPKSGVSVRRLSPGDYTWTLRAESKDGVSLSAEEPFSFTVLPVPLRESVRLVSPENSFVIGPKYLKSNRKIVFEWKKDAAATDYEFTLYQKNKNGTLRKIISEKTRGTRFVFSDLAKLDVGTFEWHVISYTHARDGFEEQKSSTAKANFSISFDLPSTVKTIEPEEMYGN